MIYLLIPIEHDVIFHFAIAKITSYPVQLHLDSPFFRASQMLSLVSSSPAILVELLVYHLVMTNS